MPLTFVGNDEGRLLLLRPAESEIIPIIPGTTVARGNALRFGTADGKAYLTASGTAATAQARGIAIKAAGSGQATDMLKRGWVGGYDLSAIPYDTPIFLDNSTGAVGTAAGTVSVLVGRVAALTDPGVMTKAVYFEFDWTTQHS